MSLKLPDIEIHPVTIDQWPEMQVLFGPRGACAGCWCMFFRLTRSEYGRQSGEGNRLAMQSIIESGEVPGLIAFKQPAEPGASPIPIGWVSVAPRLAFPALDRSRLFKPVDDQPVWSIVCFFVSRPYRRQGLTVKLIQAAVDFARRGGAQIVEAYPVEPKKDRAPDVFVYTGLYAAFLKAGFIEVMRRSETRPIMRFYL
jgi:GNAT superfamily N-acetyltransferase